MTQPRATSLDDRYGRRPARPTRRRLVVAAAAVAGVALLGTVIWAALLHATPPVTSRLVAYRVLDDTSVTARFEVSVRDGADVSCQLVARAPDHAVVGRVTLPVPPGPQRILVLDARIATERAATNAELVGCTTPDSPRPR